MITQFDFQTGFYVLAFFTGTISFVIFSFITSSACQNVNSVNTGLKWLKILIPLFLLSFFCAVIWPDKKSLEQINETKQL